MTRKKKTRSLKSIHNVKTGSISKLKRSSTTDRQSTNLKAKVKPKSVYQKFLDENPEAIEKQQQPISKEKMAEDLAERKRKSEELAASKLAARKSKSSSKPKDEVQEDVKKEREPDLLSQLDNKNFNDFY